MSNVICIVCRGSLDLGPNVCPGISGPYSSKVCTTSCGHVFHVHCINRWWKTIWDQSGNNLHQPTTSAVTHLTPPSTITSNIRLTCPLCGTLMPSPLVFELFLSTVDSGNNDDQCHEHERSELKKQIEELKAEKAALSAELMKNRQNFSLRPKRETGQMD